MDKEKAKVLLPIIRKMYPKMMADKIVGVQPMPGAGGIFNVNSDGEWTEWCRTISFWPRRSVTGKIIFGWINKRSKTIWSNSPTSAVGTTTLPTAIHKIRVREFMTDKELFTAILKGEA